VCSAYATANDCLMGENPVQATAYMKSKCMPSNSPFVYSSDQASQISACTYNTYTINVYDDQECTSSSEPSNYIQPWLSCAYVENMGYVSNGCSFVKYSKHHARIPKDALYSILLLLLMVPVFMYILVVISPATALKRDEYAASMKEAAKESPEEVDVEMT
jgi:hypothetical protein